MFSLNDGYRYWLYSEPTDMRKSFYTLSGIVRSVMGRDPLNGDVYVFVNGRRNRIKLLHMEPGGFVLYSKIFEKGTVSIPKRISSSVSAIEWRELVMMVEGIVGQDKGAVSRVRRVSGVGKMGRGYK